MGSYFKAIFTNRGVIISLFIILGGMVGWSLIDLLRVAAFSAWGVGTLPYTSSPLSILALVVASGVIGLVISESRAMRQWYATKKIVVAPIPAVVDEAIIQTEPVNLDPARLRSRNGHHVVSREDL